MTRALLAMLLAGCLAACVGPVENGPPPLTQGCQADTDCPTDYFCVAGACEQKACQSACDCPAPYPCNLGRCLVGGPRTVPDGGCPDAGS